MHDTSTRNWLASPRTFMAGVVPLSMVMSWIFNATNRITLAIILFHVSVVLGCDFLNVTPGANVWSTLLWIVAAGAVALGRRGPAPAPASTSRGTMEFRQ